MHGGGQRSKSGYTIMDEIMHKQKKKYVALVVIFIAIASLIPLFCQYGFEISAGMGDDEQSDYGTIDYQPIIKKEIRNDTSVDGISFTILADGTARITKFPVGYNNWNEEMTEMIIPGEITTSNNLTYTVSELSNTAGVLITETITTVEGTKEVETDISGKLLNCTTLHLPKSLEKICDETSYYDYDLFHQNQSILSLPELRKIEFYGEGEIKLNYIGAGAFNSVKSFPISIPSSVKYIGEAAFASLTEVNFEVDSQLEYVGDGAFYGLDEKQVIKLPNTFKYLGSAMPFGRATVTYPDSFIESDGVVYDSLSRVAYSFSGSKNDIQLLDGTEMIASKAFFGSSIQTISLPNSVKTIEQYAFGNCLLLESVTYDPNSSQLTSIGKGAFSIGWDKAIVNGETKMKQMGSDSGEFIFPSSLKTVGEAAFSRLTNMGTWNDSPLGNSFVTKITFLDNNNLTCIGDYAFSNFYSLNEINFNGSSNSVSSVILGEGAFLINVSKITSSSSLTVSFDPSFKLETIGDHCFSVYNRSISDVKEKADVGDGRLMPKFGSIDNQMTIPSTVEKIGNHAFFGCTGNQQSNNYKIIVNIGSKLSVLGSAAFYAFKGIAEIDFTNAEELKVLPMNVFNAGGNVCNDISSLKLPPNISSISNFAFYNHSHSEAKILKIEMPRSLTELGAYVFNMFNVEDFTFKNPLMKFDVNNPSFSDLKTSEIVGSRKGIGSNAQVFNLNSLPTKIDDKFKCESPLFCLIDASGNKSENGTILGCIIDNKVKIIRVGTNTEGVVIIPDNVDRILSNAFKNCKNIQSIIIEGEETVVEDMAFSPGSNGILKTILSNSMKIDIASVKDTSPGISLMSLSNSDETTEVMKNGAYWMGQSYYNKEDRVATFFFSDIYGKSISVHDVSYTDHIFTFELSCSDWYSAPDFVFTDGNNNNIDVAYTNGIYSYELSEDTVGKNTAKWIWIGIKEKTGGDDRTVTIHGNGGYFDDDSEITEYSFHVKDGKSIHESQFKNPYRNIMEVSGWFTDSECRERFDLINCAVERNLDLYPSWKAAAPRITFAEVNGTITAVSGGKIVQNGDRVSGPITISFSAPDGYEMDVWIISEFGLDPREYQTSTMEITPKNDMTISVKTHHYSGANLQPVTSADLPVSSMVKAWERGGYVDTSMGIWTGLTSTPVIVDDHVYIRVSSMLYKIETDTGYIAATAESQTVKKDYYHYLGYGDGQILDYATKKVYDLDLNFLYYMPLTMTSATYHDGYFYGPGSDGKVYRFSSEIPNDKLKAVDPNWISSFEWFGMYGQSSAPVFLNGYIYYINAVDDERYIVSVSLADAKTQRIHLESISKHMLDDGWLTYYDGKLYLTSYTVGLFGSKSSSGNATITSMDVNNGMFSDVNYTEVIIKLTTATGEIFEVPIRSILSQFVVVDGIGYLNASGGPGENSYLLAYSINDMKLYAFGESERSHGSIVVNQYDEKTTIYLLPYESKNLLKAYQYETNKNDSLKKNSYGIYTLKAISDDELYMDPTEKDGNTYNSQAVRADSEGRLFWYNDDGQLRAYTTPEKNRFFFFIENNGVAQWYESCGATAAVALSALGSEIVTLDNNNALSTMFGKNASGWKLYYLKNDIVGYQDSKNNPNGWRIINSLMDKDFNIYHYYAITKNSFVYSPSGYMYEDGTVLLKYDFKDNIGDRSIIGKQLHVYGVTIRFFDGENEIGDSKIVGSKGLKIEGSFPSVFKDNHVARWYVKGTDTRVLELPDTFSDDLEYEVKWVESDYKLSGDVKNNDGSISISFIAESNTGDSDLQDPRIVLFAKYEGDDFKIDIKEINFENGKAQIAMLLSGNHLIYVVAYIVEGDPSTHIYSDYAAYYYAEGIIP